MPYSFVLKLSAETDAVISPTQGYHAYALFLNILRQADPDMAARLHSDEGAKPFTVSPLQGKLTGSRQGLRLFGGSSYWIRVTSLEDEVFAISLASLLNYREPLRLETATFRLEEVVTTAGASPWAACRSYQGIYEGASASRQIAVEFLSPTAFRSGGKRNVLFPLPALVFGSLLARWNAFSPVKLPASIRDCLEENVLLSRYSLKTRILHFGSYQEVGFEGQCAFIIAPGAPEDVVLALNALADFAFYAGIGAKTSMGMGQTRRIENARSLPHRAGGNPA